MHEYFFAVPDSIVNVFKNLYIRFILQFVKFLDKIYFFCVQVFESGQDPDSIPTHSCEQNLGARFGTDSNFFNSGSNTGIVVP